MRKKHKKVCTTLYYIEYLPTLSSVVTGCLSNSDFDSLVGIPKSKTNSVGGLKIYAINAGIKRYKSSMTKKRNMIKQKKKNTKISKQEIEDIFIKKTR